MSEELKPCPFCGGRAVESETHAAQHWWYSVECLLCGAEITEAVAAEAITAWNTRTPSEVTP